MEIAGRWRDLPRIYERAREAILGVSGALVASAHQSHSYLDGACLYFTFAGNPGDSPPDVFYQAAWDAGTRAVLAEGGALSHHHGIGLNRARFVARRAGRRVRRARRREARARPERDPQSRQARSARSVGRTGVAVNAD